MKTGPFLTLTILALLVLAGCAPQPIKPIDNWHDHQARMTALQNWHINGQLGVRLPNNNGSARLRWHQAQGEFRIDLSGPFGQGRTQITGHPGGATLAQRGEQPLHADSAEELLTLATGWQLPVEQLLYWVRGIPSPDLHIQQMSRSSDGLLAELQQDDWHLHYSNYILLDNYWHLPRRIVAQRDDVRLTLVIHNWSAEPR